MAGVLLCCGLCYAQMPARWSTSGLQSWSSSHLQSVESAFLQGATKPAVWSLRDGKIADDHQTSSGRRVGTTLQTWLKLVLDDVLLPGSHGDSGLVAVVPSWTSYQNTGLCSSYPLKTSSDKVRLSHAVLGV